MNLDFGISPDPLAVPQRHALYDSDDSEEDEPAVDKAPSPPHSVFSLENGDTNGQSLSGKTLSVGVGSTASLFLKSFLHLRETAPFSVRADLDKVFPNRFSSGRGVGNVSTAFVAEGGREWKVYLHESEIRPELCHLWAEEVSLNSGCLGWFLEWTAPFS